MEKQINEMIQTCMEKDDSVLNIEKFTSEYVKNRNIPIKMQTVLNEIYRTGKVMKISSDELVRVIPAQNGGGDWLTWGYRNFIKPPVSWGIRKLFPSGKPIYVLKDIIKDKCKKLLDRHYCEALCDITDSVVEFRKILERNTDICKSDLEFHLVIHELIRQKKVTVQQDNQHVIVKFCSRTDSRVKPIQRSDLDIFRVKVVSDGLKNRIENLSKDIERLTVEARKHKKNKEIQKAVRCLRRRRFLNKRLNQLSFSLDMLEDILEKLRHAVSNEMILEAVQSGVCVLKEYNSKINVDLLNGSVTEVFEQHSELNSLIQEVFSKIPTTSSNTQEDLEKELNDILLNDKNSSDNNQEDQQNSDDNQAHTKMEEMLDTRLPDAPDETFCGDEGCLQLSFEPTTSASDSVQNKDVKKRSSEVADLPVLEECGIDHCDKWLSLPKSNKRRVLILHKPPSDLLCQETFVNAMELGNRESKWLLVNIQNVQEYVCQIQNKDLWSNHEVQQIIKQHFIFWQANHDSTEGEKYIHHYGVKEWPYTAIVDPRNGKNMVIWNKIDPEKLCENIEHFLFENDLGDTCSSQTTTKKIKMDTDDFITIMNDDNRVRQLTD